MSGTGSIPLGSCGVPRAFGEMQVENSWRQLVRQGHFPNGI